MTRGYSGSGGRFGGRSDGGYGTAGHHGYGASGHYGESQFGGGAADDPRDPSRHPLAPTGIHRFAAELYEDICEALLQRDDVDSSDVTVAVREGDIALDGSVPERSMRYLIEDIAAGHPAVRDVDNRIKVRKG